MVYIMFIQLDAKQIKNSCAVLRDLLASTYALRIKTQNCHWHITGPNFLMLHELFEGHYNELGEAIDEIAERMRTLGNNAPCSLKDFAKYSFIEDAEPIHHAPQAIVALLTDHETMIAFLRKSLKKLDDQEDEGTKDFLIARLQYHEKTAWFLRSHIET